MLSASVGLAMIGWRTSASVILNDQSKRLQQGMFTHRLIWTDSAFRPEAQAIRMVFLEVPQECGGAYAHMCRRWNLGSCDRYWDTSQLSGFNVDISVNNQRVNLWGACDVSVGKGTCHQDRYREFRHWRPHCERKEPILWSCPLLSTFALCHECAPTHTCTHMHTHTPNKYI